MITPVFSKIEETPTHVLFDIRSCHPFACRYSERGITPSVCTVSKLTLSQNHDASAKRPEATKVKYFIFATLYRRPRGPASPRVGRSTTAASVGVGWTHRSPIPHPPMPTNAAFHRCAPAAGDPICSAHPIQYYQNPQFHTIFRN